MDFSFLHRRSALNFVVFIAFALSTAIFLVNKAEETIAEIEILQNTIILARHRSAEERTSPELVEGWKTYRNEKYGFEVKYPLELTVEFVAPYIKEIIAQFHIHDPKYSAPEDAVGQQVRSEYQNVVFSIYPFSKEKLDSIQRDIKNIEQGNDVGISYKDKKTLPSGVTVYFFSSGLVGPYLDSYFYSNNYIFRVFTWANHMDLAIDILSTFKFIK